VSASDAALDIITLWSAHTYVFRAFSQTPRLALLSMTPGCGKSLIQKLLKRFCQGPGGQGIKASRMTEAALYALIEQSDPRPTLMLDETDTWWSPTTRKGENMRGILDDGADCDGQVWRVLKGLATPFNVYAPVCFAGIGRLPATLMDRSIVIIMKKPAGKRLAALMEWEPELFAGEAGELRAAVEAFMMERVGEFTLTPSMPKDLVLRSRQKWKPLFSIAELAGEGWPARVAKAYKELELGASASPLVAPAEELLAAICANVPETGWMTSTELIGVLRKVREEDGLLDWAIWLDNDFTAARVIGDVLGRNYQIRSGSFRRPVPPPGKGSVVRRGYKLEDFHAWADALPPEALREVGRGR
jgi:hypothetical protein